MVSKNGELIGSLLVSLKEPTVEPKCPTGLRKTEKNDMKVGLPRSEKKHGTRCLYIYINILYLEPK